MKKVTIVLFVLICALLFGSITAYACECGCACNREEEVEMPLDDMKWEDIMYEEHNVYFPLHDFFFQDVLVDQYEGKRVIEMGTFSFLLELSEDGRLLIEFYPPGDMGSRITPEDWIDKEGAIQLGNSDVYAYGFWSSISYLHTGEMLFEIPIDDEESQIIVVYETPIGWTMELVYFEEEAFG